MGLKAILDTLTGKYRILRELPTTIRYKLFPRDTPRALAAMEVADSYLQELADEKHPEPADNLRTASLITRQVRKAQWHDSDAVLKTTNNDEPVSQTITTLKLRALEAEGQARMMNGQGDKAAKCFRRATRLSPNDAHLHYCLGVVKTEMAERRPAVRALKRATKLQPKNIEYRKALDRARHISRSAKVVHKASNTLSTAVVVFRSILFLLIMWFLYAFVVGPMWTIASKPARPDDLGALLIQLFVYGFLAFAVIIVPFIVIRWFLTWVVAGTVVDSYLAITNKLRR